MAMNYSDTGKGNVVVLVHGFCEDRTVWDGLVEELQLEYRVIAFDLPGFGESTFVGTSITMEDCATQIKEVLLELGLEKVVFAGHSLGGYVGLAFLELYSELLAGFMLVHSTAFEDAPERKLARDKTVVFLEEKGIDLFARTFVPPLFLAERREEFLAEIEKFKAIAAKTNLQAAIAFTRAMRDRKERINVLAATTVPSLLLAGEKDLTVTLEVARQHFEMAPQLALEILPNAGHVGFIEESKQTAAIVRQFLATVFAD